MGVLPTGRRAGHTSQWKDAASEGAPGQRTETARSETHPRSRTCLSMQAEVHLGSAVVKGSVRGTVSACFTSEDPRSVNVPRDGKHPASCPRECFVPEGALRARDRRDRPERALLGGCLRGLPPSECWHFVSS